ncbi:type IV pilus biogenesis protein PilF (TPR repeat) [Marinobacter santoriniensis NKSG1]|uniref:Type IV pilus biogenesis protein PilF (TPR repeat) n=1 Tax=Marinobacter santoriniensis NKSG1 TaxID=1288826 RepID=M7CWP5_9GAMM|nr:type IV pilus biogenesis/stability protein PilW [Marinobacter santoriniensis]EMP56665.1 type IV pilus biogenesis protein PilF (TPR repeat) [Marinobacter santoriniensis NKSG1]
MALILVGLAGLAGCVTTTNSPFAREADKQEAIHNYVKLATAYIGQGNFERARHHLDRALQIDPDNAAALSARGLVENANGETELADESFRKAIDSDPGYTRGRVYYGAFLYAQGRMEEARNQFRAASRDTEYKDRGSVFYNLGLTQEKLGEPDKAATSYRRAVELSRGDSRPLLSLSRVLVEEGNYQAASRYYSRLLSVIAHNKSIKHSAESLYTGIRIARHFNDRDQEASLALLLKNEYPESVEYQQYKVLISNGQ